MILQKKADRRRKRAESVAKIREDTKEQIPPAPASQPIKYQHDSRKQDQGDYQATPKYQAESNGKTTSPKHHMYGNGDQVHSTSPKYQYQHQQTGPPAEGAHPSPTDKAKVSQYGSSQAVNNNNSSGYANYHTQAQQQSFGVGKCFLYITKQN